MNRVSAESAGIVTIRIPAGDRVQALPNQIVDRMPNFARLAPVSEASDQCLSQPQSTIAGLQQNSTAIRARVILVKLDHKGASIQVRK